MIYLIIYLIGYLLAFVYLICDARKDEDIYIDDILMFLIESLVSWIVFLILLVYKLSSHETIIIKKRKEK